MVLILTTIMVTTNMVTSITLTTSTTYPPPRPTHASRLYHHS